ncbi:ABC transporter permease [Desulfitibacter alkalitolerans]|uniref:ABC transporter permease n=1 Tax=Desulfitibacter alkalitolerans TaxID=264641 RepID=UPI000487C132|nr:ABC transporter permease [Desulfitibacter alkalitolerans]
MVIPLIIKDKSKIKEFFRKYGTVLGALIIFIAFSLTTERFLTSSNMLMLLRQMSMLTIIALGFTFVMGAGGFDMSIGSACGLVTMLFALTFLGTGSLLLGLMVALACGLLIGLINGFLAAYIGLPDFIATFAVGSIAYGIKMMLTKGNPIFYPQDMPAIFTFLGQGFVGPIPFPVILMFFFLALAIFVLNKTSLGRRVYAIGGNPTAALYAGINIKKYRLITFLISGLSVAIASIILTSRLGSAQPLAGEEYLLDVIAVVFLSTTMFGEGEPTPSGTFVGALIISMLNNGLTMLNVQYYFQYITKGSVVILAVLLAVAFGQKLRVKF